MATCHEEVSYPNFRIDSKPIVVYTVSQVLKMQTRQVRLRKHESLFGLYIPKGTFLENIDD